MEIPLKSSINSLLRLKDYTVSYLSLDCSVERIRIFSYKGIEIDDSDVDYLVDGQTLFVSIDGIYIYNSGSSFNMVNYLNEYIFISWIKSGGYGKVYLGKNVITGEFAAIKKNDISSLSNDEIFNISRESQFLQSLKHKNIIRIIQSFTYDNNIYTVMQHAEGGELGTYIKEQKYLEEHEAKLLFKQIVDAVKFIHGRNIVHRDLKPNNILFLDKERTELVVIDFGISGYNFGNLKEKIKAGTMAFVPPEVFIKKNYKGCLWDKLCIIK